MGPSGGLSFAAATAGASTVTNAIGYSSGSPMPTRPETSASTKPSSTRVPPGRGGHRQQVGHDRARVPEQVAPAPLVVLPGRPPGDAREHQAQRQVSDGRLRGGPGQAGPQVPVSEPTQDELGRLEVGHPGGKVTKGPQTTYTSVGYSAPAEGAARNRTPPRNRVAADLQVVIYAQRNLGGIDQVAYTSFWTGTPSTRPAVAPAPLSPARSAPASRPACHCTTSVPASTGSRCSIGPTRTSPDERHRSLYRPPSRRRA
jgi:hypothetical protein